MEGGRRRMGSFQGKGGGGGGIGRQRREEEEKRGEGMKGRGRAKDEGEERISPHEEKKSVEVLGGVWKLYSIVNACCMRCTDV